MRISEKSIFLEVSINAIVVNCCKNKIAQMHIELKMLLGTLIKKKLVVRFEIW